MLSIKKNLELLNELLGVGGGDDDATLGRHDEAIVHGLVDERKKRVVIAMNIKQTHLHTTPKK